MKILRRKLDNVVIFAGEDSISITVVANNAFWIDHGNGNTYTMQDADQFEDIEDVTLPWTLETVTRDAGVIETINEVRDITTNATTTSLSVFSQ